MKPLLCRVVLIASTFLSLPAVLLAQPAWAPNTSYNIGARVTYSSKVYQCIQAHTSQSTWTPPSTPALWLRPEPAACSSWQSQTSYAMGSVAKFDGKLYRVIQAHTSQSNWTPPATPALWAIAAGDACVPSPTTVVDALDHTLEMARGKLTPAVTTQFKSSFDYQVIQPTIDGLRYAGASEEKIATVRQQMTELKSELATRAGIVAAGLLDGKVIVNDLQRRLDLSAQEPALAPQSIEIVAHDIGAPALNTGQSIDDIIRDGFVKNKVEYLWDGLKATYRFRRSDQPTIIYAEVKTEVKAETKDGKTTVTGSASVSGKPGGLNFTLKAEGKVDVKDGKATPSGSITLTWTKTF